MAEEQEERGRQGVGTPGLSQQSDKRRKRVTVVVAGALAAAVLTVAGAYWWSRGRREKAGPAPQPLPANVKNQLSGYTYTRSDGGRRVFTVHAARTVAFNQGGSTVLQDVYVEVFGATGKRRDVLRTEQCDYNPTSGELMAGGKVNIELNDLDAVLPDAGLLPRHSADRGSPPVFVETSKVSFKQQGTLLETDEAVQFRSGLTSGTAEGMTYDTRTGFLELEKNVVMNIQPRGGPRPDPEAKLTASRLRFEKDKEQASLWGPIEISQGGRRVLAGHGTILLAGSHRVTRAILGDGVRGADISNLRRMDFQAQGAQAVFDGASGQLRSVLADGDVQGEMKGRGKMSRLTAQQLEITFSGLHPRPVNGRAAGNVRLSDDADPASSRTALESRKGERLGAAKEDLTAAQLLFSFRPDQQTLQEAQTVGMGHLVLIPSNPDAGGREVFAEPLMMDFDARSRLEMLRGTSRVRVISHPPKQAPVGSLDEESTSNSLKATFEPATGSLIAMEQTGDFQFRQGERKGSAERAVYEGGTQAMTLTGHPRIWDADSRVLAERIIVDLHKNTAEGLGQVKSTRFDAMSPAAGSGKGVPTNVVADRMLVRRDSQFVHYEGHVRAWHGQDVFESPSLDVYKTERRISSMAGVLTSYLQPAPVDLQPGAAPSSARREGRLVTIRADRLDYSEEGRKATYGGNAELRTENSTLRSDRLEVFLSAAASSQVERAVADGHVTVVQPSRRATGEHGEYFAAQGKILLTGGPPTVYDAAQGFTTGRSLTLFLHDDTIFVDGGDKAPTLSKHRISP